MNTSIPIKGRRHQGGLSLVEIMVALALSLLLTLVVGNLFVQNKRSYSFQSEFGRIQENARFAVEQMAFDTRMAGFYGCGSSTLANVIEDSSGNFNHLLDINQAVRAFPAASASIPSAVPATAGEVLVVNMADPAGAEYTIDDPPGHNPASAVIPIVGQHDLEPGEVVIITDCKHAAIYANTSNTNQNLNHNTGNISGSTLKNCDKSLGVPAGSTYSDCVTADLVAYTYSGTVSLLRFASYAYYLAASSLDASRNSLYRQELGANALVAEEVAEGVEDMYFRFGVDTGGADDEADEYKTTQEMVDEGLSWDQVRSVQLNLLFASDGNLLDTDKTYSWKGGTITDRSLRQVVTSTVGVRNKLN